MNLVCVKSGKIKNLTEGRLYKVVRENNGIHLGSNIPYSGVWVINDAGIEKHYSKARFLSVSEYRNIKIEELGI